MRSSSAADDELGVLEPPGGRLFCGDNVRVLRAHVPDASVDLIYADPPFNSGHAYYFTGRRAEGRASWTSGAGMHGHTRRRWLVYQPLWWTPWKHCVAFWERAAT